ncbi:MAG: hypothetical protein AAGE96_11665 [Cyanobacteria bacterium P01_G01_bin.19]
MKLSSFISISICALLLVAFVQQPALAYVGPGTGIAALGALLAILAAVIIAIFGFLWFPLKRMMKKRQEETNAAQERGEV